MERPSKSLIVAVVLICSIAFFAHLWYWLEPACANENRRIIMKAAGGVGCFEFWLNRYQSLIGNVLTAGVAVATLYWIARQLISADKQLEVNRRQAAASAAAALRSVALDAKENVAGLQEAGSGLDAIRRIAANYASEATSLFVLGDQKKGLQDINSRLIATLEALAHVQARAAIGPVHQATGAIGTHLARLASLVTEGIEFDDGTPIVDLSPDAVGHEARRLAKLLSQIRDLAAQAPVVINPAIEASFDQVEQTWKQMRRFEAIAIGQEASV